MNTKEMIEVMQAYEDGARIEYIDKQFNGMWQECLKPVWDWINNVYRVKEKTVYRPYKNIKEFINAQKEHTPEKIYTVTSHSSSNGGKRHDFIVINLQEAFNALSKYEKEEFIINNMKYCSIGIAMNCFSDETIESWLRIYAEDYGYKKQL